MEYVWHERSLRQRHRHNILQQLHKSTGNRDSESRTLQKLKDRYIAYFFYLTYPSRRPPSVHQYSNR